MEEEGFRYYAELDSEGKCISICGALWGIDNSQFILISEEDYSLVGKEFIDGCFIGDSSLEFSTESGCFIPKVEDEPTVEVVDTTVEDLQTQVAILTKVLEDNNLL